MYDEYVSLRVLRLRFFPSSPDPPAGLVAFFATFDSAVVLAGAFDAVEGALPAVDAGFGAMSTRLGLGHTNEGLWLRRRVTG